jgi:hypothetical protein
MSFSITFDRLLNRSSRQSVGGSFWFDPTAGVSAHGIHDPSSLSEAQLADLRRALEFYFGPDLSGIRVYIGACRHERC